ncbi:MAG: 3-dehydroquinate synthase [Pseudomonadota bacterium]
MGTAPERQTVKKIEISLPTDNTIRNYSIHIGAGLIGNIATYLTPLLKRPFTVIVTDEAVRGAQGAKLENALRAANIRHVVIALPPGEATKSFDQLSGLMSRLLAVGVERSDLIIAFGGGVIGDLVGLAAGLLRRGCRFAQIPTSLLAQVDSSVGGKTAVNTPEGKNLVGLFYQPSIVLADTDTLTTLPDRQMRAGYAEVVKYGVLGDANFFAWLEEHSEAVLEKDEHALTHVVSTSVKAKANIVEQDEKESGARALLNLGHTFGHALEAGFGYSHRLLHGEAIAAGMGLAMDYSVQQELCPAKDATRLKTLLTACGLPTGLHDLPEQKSWQVDELIDRMKQDKKVEAGALTLILSHGIGDAQIYKDVEVSRLERFLKSAGAQ